MKKTTSAPGCSRRQFLGRAAAAVPLFPLVLTNGALGDATRPGANDRITMGLIGAGGRGEYDMQAFMAQPDVRMVAVCDAKRERREAVRGIVNQAYGNEDCAAYIDMMELLARPDIDAVVIATGDNNHSLAAIMAARAGKDMYCEKPMSVAISESRAVSDTMRRLGRVFQCGTQRRSIGNFRLAADLALSGKLGRLKELHAEEASGFKNIHETVLPAEPEPPREELDWNGWLGAALWRPYNSKYPQRGYWSDHLDFSGGSITEWGSHTVDLCQWANGTDDTGPVEFWQEGERFIGRYANGVKLVIRTGLRFGSCPVRYEGEDGWVETGDSGEIEIYPKSLARDMRFKGGYPVDNHARTFLDCVRTRQQPNSHAETAHRSISACHVANICKRLGRPVKWDPLTESFPDDPEANRMRARAWREPWHM